MDPRRIYVAVMGDLWEKGPDRGLYRTIDGGASWQRILFVSDSTGVVDLVMRPDQPGTLFAAAWERIRRPAAYRYGGITCGVYKSTDGGTVWTLLPDQPITQFYRLALDLTNPGRLYGGAQDNGTLRTLTGGLADWTDIYGGDGMEPLVHPTNPQRIWAQYRYGALNYSSDGGGSWVNATSGIDGSDRRNWNSPVCFDPSNPTRMYFGTQRVYRSTNGTSWTALSPDLTGGPAGGSQGQVYGTLTTIAVSPLDGQVVWAGSDDGHVQVTVNDGAGWTDGSAALPDRWITAVRPSPHDRATCFVTISGFRWGSPLPHVFRTTDFGANWTPIAGDLPEVPVNDLAVDPTDPQRLFVGTDLGAWETVDGGTHWVPLGSNLPNVVVSSLALNASTGVLVAATYGRGMFDYDLSQPSAAPGLPPVEASLPGRTFLAAPVPNPAQSRVAFRWAAEATLGSLAIETVSVTGRRAWSAPVTSKGRIEWDLRGADGRRVAAGRHFILPRFLRAPAILHRTPRYHG